VSLLVTFVVHEAKLQLRSLRFRLLSLGYVMAACAPPALVAFHQRQTDTLFGCASYAAELAGLQPALTALLCVALSLDAILREQGDGQWAVLSLAPVSNAGYLVRRTLAIWLIALPVLVTPLVAAWAMAAAAGAPCSHPSALVLPFLSGTLPLSVVATALGVAVGTVAGGEVTGLACLFLLIVLVPAALNAVLARWGRQVTPPLATLGLEPLSTRIRWARLAWAAPEIGIAPVLPASEAGLDVRAAVSIAAASLTSSAALAALCFGIAPAFLQRCRRDLRPWHLHPTHPLRTLLRLLNRLRQRYAPDGGLAAPDRTVAAAALLLFGVCALAFWSRDADYRRQAITRYATEVAGGPATTPSEVAPTSSALSGTLRSSGAVDLWYHASFRNQGSEPVAHLAFSLSPRLAIAAIASTGQLRLRRTGERLALELAPPLAARESRSFTFHLTGTPAEVEFALPPLRGASFVLRYGFIREGHLAADLSDLADSWPRRAVSSRRVDLRASDLFPVPRYASWALTPPPSQPGAPGLEVPAESRSPRTTLAFDLTVPADQLLGEPCGATSDGARRRLRGRCILALDEWSVAGAALVPLAAGRPLFAVLPAHHERAALHRAMVAAIPSQVEEAWPGLGTFEPVVFEWPPPYDPDLRSGMGDWSPWDAPLGGSAVPVARGHLLLIPEQLLLGSRPIPAGSLVAELVRGTLLARRPIVAAQQALWRALIGALVRRRLGLAPAQGAVVVGRHPSMFRQSLYGEASFDRFSPAQARLEAVVADLTHRVGDGNLRRGIESFLTRRSAGPGTIPELLATVAATAAVPLATVEQDFFRGEALPELELGEVRVSGRGPWQVRGVVRNRADGEAWCPLVTQTETDSLETAVRVASGGTTPFALTASSPPRRVSLDPDGVCLRFRPLVGGAAEWVELHPEGGR
jgi:hypothetical protein